MVNSEFLIFIIDHFFILKLFPAFHCIFLVTGSASLHPQPKRMSFQSRLGLQSLFFSIEINTKFVILKESNHESLILSLRFLRNDKYCIPLLSGTPLRTKNIFKHLKKIFAIFAFKIDSSIRYTSFKMINMWK